MNAIELRNVTKQLGSFQLNLPQLTVKKGYVTGFIGENGSGKTTTIKLIMDMLFADSGSITLLGQDSHLQAEQLKEQIGYTGDQMGFVDRLTLKQLKHSIAPFYSQWDEQRYQNHMTQMGLDENVTYAKLSRGMKKKFDFIMAIAHHPQLLILDEPTANLDPLAREQLLDMCLQQLEQDDMTIFFSSHITTDLEKIADYIVFLHKGQIFLEDTKDHLLESHRIVRGKTQHLVPEVAELLIHLEQNTFNFEGLTANWQQVYQLLGDEAVYEKATLEDIFIQYVHSLEASKKGFSKV